MASSTASLRSRQSYDLNGPSLPPPIGQVSNLDNPPNGNYFAVPLITFFTVISAIAFAGRFYAKWLVKKLNIADYLTFAVFPIFIAYIYYSYRLSYEGGYLVHQWDIRLGNAAKFNFVTFVATLLYLWIVALVKCAILIEWVEIFVPKGERTYFTWACWATGTAFVLLSFIIFILDLVNCVPFKGSWDPLVPAKCKFGIAQFGLASATVNFVLDLVPIFLAQRVIWKLRMSVHKKVGVSFIFLIGLAGCGASLSRLYFSTRFYVSDDVSYWYSTLAITSLAETTSAILVLCVPFFPKAFGGLRQSRMFSLISRHSAARHGSGSGPQSGNSGYTKNSASYDPNPGSRELRRLSKPHREHWFDHSRITATDTLRSVNETREDQSVDSERPLAKPGDVV
ncbi:hypothetical protein F5Y16DRAFT_161048 [Xylariaceae sp. FL0255]|nr:hypothetical protein F5Y16DRAFT_161048 [Xylariaceae sp. FL0255]